MTKKPRENRVPIMMSDDELTAVDDWRFSNRVATRSDAVRRLCQTGIVADGEIKIVRQRAERALKAMFFVLEKPDIQFSKAPKGLRGALAAALDEQMEAVRSAYALKIASDVLNDGSDTAEVDELLHKVETHLEVLREPKK